MQDDEINLKWTKLIKIRDICNLSIEKKRAEKTIGSSLEASLKIQLNSEYMEIAKDTDFSELCITSSAIISKNEKPEIEVETVKAEGKKCPVCWKISKEPCDRHG